MGEDANGELLEAFVYNKEGEGILVRKINEEEMLKVLGGPFELTKNQNEGYIELQVYEWNMGRLRRAGTPYRFTTGNYTTEPPETNKILYMSPMITKLREKQLPDGMKIYNSPALGTLLLGVEEEEGGGYKFSFFTIGDRGDDK